MRTIVSLSLIAEHASGSVNSLPKARLFPDEPVATWTIRLERLV